MHKAISGLTLLLAFTGVLAARDVTFHRDVLPLLRKNCQSCHRPGEAGPMAFLTYNQTRPYAKAIKQAVVGRKMPPWFADPSHGDFSNDRRLKQTEIDTIVKWVDGGAKEGDSKTALAPVKWTNGWNIGTPDLVLEMPTEYAVPASGTIDYTHFVLPTNFKEDRWIVAAEVRPGARTVVHHAVAFVRGPKSKWLREAKVGEPYALAKRWSLGTTPYEEVIDTYVPGAIPHKLQPGQAKFIPAGSDIVLQMHYTSNGTAAIDRSRIGLIFATEPPKERLFSMAVTNLGFRLPPGDPNYLATGKFTYQHDVKLIALSPHMHLRGKSMEYRAVLPDGTVRTLLNVPKYDFAWQLFYYLASPIELPRGTRIEVTAGYDNSANNPRNPDPTKEVRWGDQSWEEMLVAFVDVAIPADLDIMTLYRPARPAAGAED